MSKKKSSFVTTRDLANVLGLAVTTIYRGVDRGFYPQPIRMSERRRGWAIVEADRIVDGVAKGFTEAQMCELATKIMADRNLPPVDPIPRSEPAPIRLKPKPEALAARSIPAAGTSHLTATILVFSDGHMQVTQHYQ